MKLVAVYDDSMFMFADKDTDQLEETDKCIVYNKDADTFAPELCVGSWSARMGPWELPTNEQVKESEQWLKSRMTEQKK